MMMFTNLNCTRCEMCSSAMNVFNNGTILHYILLFQLLITPVSLLGNSLVTISIYFSKEIHCNVKALFISLFTSMFIANIGVLLTCIYQLYAGFIIPEEDRCDWQIFKVDSAIALKNIYMIGAIGISISSILFAIERTAAAVTYKTYAKNRRPVLTIALLIMIHIISTCSVLSLDIGTSKQMYPYAAVELSDGKKATEIVKFLFGVNVFSCFMFTLLWIFNQSRLRKFDINDMVNYEKRREIIKCTILISPVILLCFMLTTSQLVVFHTFLPLYDKTTMIDTGVLRTVERYATWAEYQVCLIPVFTLILSSLLPLLCSPIRDSLTKVCGLERCLGKKPEIAPMSTLTVQWNDVTETH